MSELNLILLSFIVKKISKIKRILFILFILFILSLESLACFFLLSHFHIWKRNCDMTEWLIFALQYFKIDFFLLFLRTSFLPHSWCLFIYLYNLSFMFMYVNKGNCVLKAMIAMDGKLFWWQFAFVSFSKINIISISKFFGHRNFSNMIRTSKKIRFSNLFRKLL